MRISINLATRPFVELRPLLARLRLAMIALAVLGVGMFFGLQALNARAVIATAEMNSLKAETATYTQERTANEARMRRPENEGVLIRSQFLNALFARKSFSWTAVMMDLERVTPSGVQVTAIEPVISKDGDVSIRLRVIGDRDKAIQLVRNLERSQRFMAPRLTGETAVAADKAMALGRPGAAQQASLGANQVLGNDVEFEIVSGYNPLPVAAMRHEERKAHVESEAGTAADQTGDQLPMVHHQRKLSPQVPAGGAR